MTHQWSDGLWTPSGDETHQRSGFVIVFE